MKPITHTSDQIGDFHVGLTKATTLAALTKHLQAYRDVASDAWEARPQTAEEFEAWRAGLAKERRCEFAGEAFCYRFGAVLMPELLMRVGFYADNYKVPFGRAFIRLQEVGRIRKSADGPYAWVNTP